MPHTTLLGYVEDLPATTSYLTIMLLLLMKRRVAIHWGRHTSPKFDYWLKDAAHCQRLEDYWVLMSATSHPKDIWSPLSFYLALQAAIATSLSDTVVNAAPLIFTLCHEHVCTETLICLLNSVRLLYEMWIFYINIVSLFVSFLFLLLLFCVNLKPNKEIFF